MLHKHAEAIDEGCRLTIPSMQVHGWTRQNIMYWRRSSSAVSDMCRNYPRGAALTSRRVALKDMLAGSRRDMALPGPASNKDMQRKHPAEQRSIALVDQSARYAITREPYLQASQQGLADVIA